LTVRRELATKHFSNEYLNIALREAAVFPSDNTDVISALIQAGADVNSQDQYGVTPLMVAVPKMNLANIRSLLGSGADLTKRSNNGATAYSIAVQQMELAGKGNHHPTT
jgi:ankyrin repeat protein